MSTVVETSRLQQYCFFYLFCFACEQGVERQQRRLPVGQACQMVTRNRRQQAVY